MPTIEEYEVQERSLKKLMVRVLSGAAYKAYVLGGPPRVFHETLLLLQERGWVSPEELADKLGRTEESVSLWFEETDSRWSFLSDSDMEVALQKVQEILKEGNNYAND